MFHTNCILVTSIILQMKSISPPALPILITAGFPIWSINGVEHPEPDLKLKNSGHTTTSNPTVITFMQTQGPSPIQYELKIGICVHCFWRWIDLENCFVQFNKMLKETEEERLCGLQMSCCHKYNIQALDGSSTFLTSMTFRDNMTIANHCVFINSKCEDHGFWQSSLVFLLKKCSKSKMKPILPVQMVKRLVLLN